MTPAPRDRDQQPTSGAEFDFALDHAEDLLARVDQSRQRVNRQLSMIVLGWIWSMLVVVALASVVPGVWARVVVPFLVAVANLASTGFLVKFVVRAKHSVEERDERCAIETVNILRELLPIISRDEQWSLLRTEHARLRIARFGIAVRSSR